VTVRSEQVLHAETRYAAMSSSAWLTSGDDGLHLII
jgi:hypothetical protein